MTNKVTIGDFSQNNIKKAVTRTIVTHPALIYPVCFSCMFAGFSIAFLSNLIIGIFSLVPPIFFILFLLARREYFANNYIAKLNYQLEKQKEEILYKLDASLSNYINKKEVENFANQALEQKNKIRLKFEGFINILNDKLDSKELTYNRFLGAAEQVNLSVLDNLGDVVNRLKILDNIDLAYIQSRLNYLENLTNPEPADISEISTLKSRMDIKKKQFTVINDILTKNEESMTQIDETMVAVAELKNKDEQAQMDNDMAKKNLEQMIERYL